jgi:hypothetical protein
VEPFLNSANRIEVKIVALQAGNNMTDSTKSYYFKDSNSIKLADFKEFASEYFDIGTNS